MFNRSGSCRLRLENRTALVIAFLSVLLTSCGVSKDLQKADQAVGDFHSQFDSEQYQSIYEGATDAFHKATSEADFTALLQAIHRKLGKVQQSRRQYFHINFNTSQGEVISLEYSTNFDGGPGNESFVWQFDGNRPVLLSYHINSNALIMK